MKLNDCNSSQTPAKYYGFAIERKLETFVVIVFIMVSCVKYLLIFINKNVSTGSFITRD